MHSPYNIYNNIIQWPIKSVMHNFTYILIFKYKRNSILLLSIGRYKIIPDYGFVIHFLDNNFFCETESKNYSLFVVQSGDILYKLLLTGLLGICIYIPKRKMFIERKKLFEWNCSKFIWILTITFLRVNITLNCWVKHNLLKLKYWFKQLTSLNWSI